MTTPARIGVASLRALGWLPDPAFAWVLSVCRRHGIGDA